MTVSRDSHMRHMHYFWQFVSTLGNGLPLFTVLPRRSVLGNSVSGYEGSRKLAPKVFLRRPLTFSKQAIKLLVALPEHPPPPLGPPQGCLLQLVVPEQLHPPVGQQNLKHPVVGHLVALLYRTDRPLLMWFFVIHLHPHPRAHACVL